MLILPKVLAFVTAFSGVAWNRFSPILLISQTSLSASNIGTLKSMGFGAKLIFQPFWGCFADRVGPDYALITSYLLAMFSLELVRQAIVRRWSLALFLVIRFIRSGQCFVGVTLAADVSAQTLVLSDAYRGTHNCICNPEITPLHNLHA